jgi:hypothetical protein
VENAIFAGYLAAAKITLGDQGAGLSDYDARELDYRDAECYASADGRTGAAILSSRYNRGEVAELAAVFNYGDRGLGAEMARHVVKMHDDNIILLDCFDVGELPAMYAALGFVEIRREAWNAEFAPKGWNADRFGRPEVVYMMRPPGRRDGHGRVIMGRTIGE